MNKQDQILLGVYLKARDAFKLRIHELDPSITYHEFIHGFILAQYKAKHYSDVERSAIGSVLRITTKQSVPLVEQFVTMAQDYAINAVLSRNVSDKARLVQACAKLTDLTYLADIPPEDTADENYKIGRGVVFIESKYMATAFDDNDMMTESGLHIELLARSKKYYFEALAVLSSYGFVISKKDKYVLTRPTVARLGAPAKNEALPMLEKLGEEIFPELYPDKSLEELTAKVA